MKLKKSATLLSLSLISSTIISCTISCSSTSNSTPSTPDTPEPNPNPDSSFQSKIEQAFANNLLEIRLNNLQPTISQNIFNFYNTTNNFKKLENIFELKNINFPQSVTWELSEQPKYNSNTNQLSFKLKIIDSNTNEIAFISKNINYQFNSTEQYINESFDVIQRNNLVKLVDSYASAELIDLFSQATTNLEFINQFIDLSQIKLIGLEPTVVSIPSQTINNLSKTQLKTSFKVSISFIDKTLNNGLVLPNSRETNVMIVPNQPLPITIINQDDLSNSTITNKINTSYIGKLFIRPNSNLVNENVNINFLAQNSNIIGQLDLSHFLHITFSNNSNFSLNKITDIKFNPQATVENLHSDLFTNNKIKSIDLPKNVINFNNNAFDSNCLINNLESIDLFSSVVKTINGQRNLYLNNLNSESELNQFFNILKRESNLIFNEVWLPKFSFTSTLSLQCNSIHFYDYSLENKVCEFSSNISSWKIVEPITIPNYIVKINKINLPSSATIHREFNQVIKDLITPDGILYFDQKSINFSNATNPSSINGDLKSKIWNLDDYFYSFNNDQNSKLNINKIIIEKDFDSVPNISNVWGFFFNNSNTHKEIIFKSSVKAISYEYYNWVTSANNQNIIITRENPFDSTILNSGRLNLANFYTYQMSKQINANNLLVGCGQYINSIDVNGVDTIKRYTFSKLNDFENVEIDLSNIKTIESQAFYYSKIRINSTNFLPNKIEANAFYDSKLSGILNLSSLTQDNIASYAFGRTGISEVTLANTITTINSFAFADCNQLASIDLSNVLTINDSAFSNTCLKNINLSPNIKTIRSNAFRGVNNSLVSLSNFDLSKFNIDSIFGNNFGNNIFSKPNLFNANEQSVLKSLNYDSATKIWDMSQLDFSSELVINNLKLFANNYSTNIGTSQNPIKELKLPLNCRNMELFRSIFINKHIDLLTWDTPTGNATKNLYSNFFSGIYINRINKGFFIGMNSIPSSLFGSSSPLANQTIDLYTVESVGDRAFFGMKNLVFERTDHVSRIGSFSFDSSVTFTIGENVQLKHNSFSIENVVNNPASKITRKKIFSDLSNFNRIYSVDDQNGITLDFSRIELSQPWLSSQLSQYIGIGNYLATNKIHKVILPNSYIIPSGLLNNLVNIEFIEFSEFNQIIEPNVFDGTNVINKPQKEQTNILYDGANFFN